MHYGRDRCLLHILRFCAFVNIGCGSVDTKNPQPLYSRDWLQLCFEFAYSQLCACPRSETLWSQTHKTCRKKNKKTKTETTETRDACLKKKNPTPMTPISQIRDQLNKYFFQQTNWISKRSGFSKNSTPGRPNLIVFYLQEWQTVI